jgi:hypothetical protein
MLSNTAPRYRLPFHCGGEILADYSSGALRRRCPLHKTLGQKYRKRVTPTLRDYAESGGEHICTHCKGEVAMAMQKPPIAGTHEGLEMFPPRFNDDAISVPALFTDDCSSSGVVLYLPLVTSMHVCGMYG